MSEEVLKKNLKEYMEIADYSFQKKCWNAAVTLYYKALVEICDLILFRSSKKIGANHTERFKMLKDVNPDLYATASKLFRFYRDSYNKEISPAIAKVVKEEVGHAKELIADNKED